MRFCSLLIFTLILYSTVFNLRLLEMDQTLEVFCDNRLAVFLASRLNESHWIICSEAIKQTTHVIQTLHMCLTPYKTNDSRDSNASYVSWLLQLVFEILLIMFCASDKLLIKRIGDFVMRSFLYDSFDSFGLVFRAPCKSVLLSSETLAWIVRGVFIYNQ